MSAGDRFSQALHYTRTRLEASLGSKRSHRHPSNHGVHALNKGTLDLLWAVFPDDLRETSAAKFRTNRDFSLLSLAYPHAALHWRLAVTGQMPCWVVALTQNEVSNRRIVALLERYDPTVLCINAICDPSNATEMLRFLERRFPERASFEQ